MSRRWRPTPGSFAWLLIAIVALVCLVTATLVPQPIAATAFLVASFCWFRSGTVVAGESDERP